jgi:hypothetical protein
MGKGGKRPPFAHVFFIEKRFAPGYTYSSLRKKDFFGNSFYRLELTDFDGKIKEAERCVV